MAKCKVVRTKFSPVSSYFPEDEADRYTKYFIPIVVTIVTASLQVLASIYSEISLNYVS